MLRMVSSTLVKPVVFYSVVMRCDACTSYHPCVLSGSLSVWLLPEVHAGTFMVTTGACTHALEMCS